MRIILPHPPLFLWSSILICVNTDIDVVLRGMRICWACTSSALCYPFKCVIFPAFNTLPLRETGRKSNLHNNAHHIKLLQWVIKWPACKVGNVNTGERSKACWRAAARLLLFAKFLLLLLHTCIYIYIYMYMYMYMYRLWECLLQLLHIHMFICIHIHIYFWEILPAAAAAPAAAVWEGSAAAVAVQPAHAPVCAFVCMCICMCVCMCVYVCMCVCGAQRQTSQTAGILFVCVCVCVCVARSGKRLKQQEQQHVMRWRPGSYMPHRTPICKRTVNSSAGDRAASCTRWGQSSRRRSARWRRPRWCLSWSRTAWSTRAPRCSCSRPVSRARTWAPWSCRGGWCARSRGTSSVAYEYVYIYMCFYIYIYVHIYMYIYVNIHFFWCRCKTRGISCRLNCQGALIRILSIVMPRPPLDFY